jgi:hypothetical protein
MDVEAVGEQQRGALLEELLHLLVQFRLREIGNQHRDQRRTFHGLDRLGDLEAVFLRLLPARAVLANADDHVVAAVSEIQRVRAALAPVAQDGDPGLLESPLVHVFAGIQLRHCHQLLINVHNKNPASARAGAGFLGVCLSEC